MTSELRETVTGAGEAAQTAPGGVLPAGRNGTPQLSGNITTALVVATAAAGGGGPAAALPWDGGTVLERLLAQLADIGVPRAYVITRPGWEETLRPSAGNAAVLASAGLSEDLGQIAEIARARKSGLVLVLGDIVTHRSALAGLLASPGVVTGALATGGGHGSPFAPRARTARGRVVSAASAFHGVAAPRTSFLGVLKVASADHEAFAEVAEELAELSAGGLPDGWQRELDQKAEGWRLTLARSVIRAERRAEREALQAQALARGESTDVELPLIPPEEWGEKRRAVARDLPPEEDAEFRRRYAAAAEDVVSILLVGLIRRGVHVGNSFVRRFFWTRPLSREGVERAAVDIQDYDEDRELLRSAVKAADGFFTTFFVSTWSRYVARWAARRGLTPNTVTTVSLLIGILAATAFATGERAGLVVGAVLIYLAFVTDCVDGQLARYTRTFSKFGAWLDSVFDRSKEYIAFAGLAIGAGAQEVWILAAATLTLQSVRHAFDFSYGATDRQAIADTPQPPVAQAPDDALGRSRMKSRGTLEAKLGALRPQARPVADEDDDGDQDGRSATRQRRPLARRILALWRIFDRIPGMVWVKKMLSFPIGERFAVIVVTAALFTPRTTFIVLLAWGGFALLYTLAGRILRSIAQWRSIAR